MARNFATVMMAALLLSTSALSRDLSDEQRAYVAEIAAQRQAADLEMRDEHWSPLALTQMFFLDTKNISIGSGAGDSLVLQGPAVVAGHAGIVAKPAGERIHYTIQAAAGPLFIDSNDRQEVTELLLEKGGPRLRVGRNILYFREGDWLGPRINVLDFESPAYTLFDGLDYYPIDPEYRVEAILQPYDEPRETRIIDTMGFVSTAWVYGVANFTLKGEPSQLKVVLFTQDPTPDTIFYLMFGDKTNGRETYGAGRYLLPKFVSSGNITLDFNRSVNPSCAYNSGFACPMPPAGNRFSFKVTAGIKDYSHRPPR